MVYYNLKTLFILVPMHLAISIVKNILQQELLLPHMTYMSTQQIITLYSTGSKVLISSSRVNILNRSMVQPWVAPLVPYCQPVHGRV